MILYHRGDTVLLFEMGGIAQDPRPVRPAIVLRALPMPDAVRYLVLCGTEKILATQDEVFATDEEVQTERERRQWLVDIIRETIKE